MPWWLQLALALIPVLGAGIVAYYQFKARGASEETGALKAEKAGRETIDDMERRLREADRSRPPKPSD